MSRKPDEHLTDDELKHLLDEVADSTTAAASAYGPELRAALHELGQLRGRFPCRSGIMVHESEQSVPSGRDQRIHSMVPTVEIVIGTSRFICRCRDAEHRREVALKAREATGFDPSDDYIALTAECDRLSSALQGAARDGEEFHRMQETIANFEATAPGLSPGLRGEVGREIYVQGWEDAAETLLHRLRREGLMPS
jgi:hypothetical protein